MRSLVLSSACLGLVLTSPGIYVDSARACSLPQDSIVVRDTPANGVVVIETQCFFGTCFDGELPEELPVVELGSDALIPGEIVRVEGTLGSTLRIAWRPDEALTVGTTYEVLWQPEAEQDFAELDFEFTALPAVSWTAEDVVFDTRLELSEHAVESLQCEATWMDSCGGHTTSVMLKQRHAPLLSAWADADQTPAAANELFVLSTAFWADGETVPAATESTWMRSHYATHLFDARAQAYCYRLEVTSLVDDSTAVREDCVEHADLGEVRTIEVSDADLIKQLRHCEDLPEDDEELALLWCMARRARCAEAAASDWTEAGCDTIEAECDVIEAEHGGTGGSGGAGGAGGESGASAGTGSAGTGTAGMSAGAGQSGSAGEEPRLVKSSCATRGPGSVNTGHGALTMFLLLAGSRLFARRRGRL